MRSNTPLPPSPASISLYTELDKDDKGDISLEDSHRNGLYLL